MFSLLDIFLYSDTKLFKDFDKKTSNRVAKYEISFNLRLDYFRAYYYKRVSDSIRNSDYYKDREVKTALNLSHMDTANYCNRVSDYLARTSMIMIKSLTQFVNHTEYYSYLNVSDLEIPNLVLDAVRAINCNYLNRRIANTNSILQCKKLTVDTDLNKEDLALLQDLFAESIKINKILTILNIDTTTLISDFTHLYHSNQFDTSIMVVDRDGINVVSYIGENTDDADFIMGLLIQPNYTKTENISFRTSEHRTKKKECLDILKFGEVKHDNLENKHAYANEIIVAELTSKVGQYSNVNTISSSADDKVVDDRTVNKPKIRVALSSQGFAKKKDGVKDKSSIDKDKTGKIDKDNLKGSA